MKLTVVKQEPLQNAPLTVPDVMRQDLFHMASVMGTRLLRLFPNHSTEESNYFILVDLHTGDRQKITIEYSNGDLYESKVC